MSASTDSPNLRRNVLDHGFIELVDWMGNDLTPAHDARRSKATYGEYRDPEQEMRLTRYMFTHGHTSPFEMVELKWRVKVPIFVARQWLRHRTANVNEFSMRAADPATLSADGAIEYYTPTVWRGRDPENKQGSKELDYMEGQATDTYWRSVQHSIDAYGDLMKLGVAPEMARMALPVSVYTEFIWKNDLHNTLHFLRLRTDEHAQWEIQEYARAMVDIMKVQFPRLMAEVWSG